MSDKIQISRISEDGFYLEPVLVNRNRLEIEAYDTLIEEDGTETKFLKPDIVLDEVPEGLFTPKWSGTEWVEGKPLEEIEAIKNAPQPKSETQLLGEELVMKDLKIMQLESDNKSLGEQVVDHDIRLMMGGL